MKYGFIKGTILIDGMDKKIGDILRLGTYIQGTFLRAICLTRPITVLIDGETVDGKEIVIPRAKMRYCKLEKE